MSTRILLADDHTLMRQGLRHILESHPDFDIVAEASSGIEAVEAARAASTRCRDCRRRHEGIERHRGHRPDPQALARTPPC